MCTPRKADERALECTLVSPFTVCCTPTEIRIPAASFALATRHADDLVSEQLPQQLLSGQSQVLCHLSKNGAQRARSKRAVARYGYVVLAVKRGRQAQMTYGLSCEYIAIHPKQPGKFVTTQIAREPHAGTTSSRTACRRMSSGSSCSSKWQRTASRTASLSSSQVSASVNIAWPMARATNPPYGASSTTNRTSLAIPQAPLVTGRGSQLASNVDSLSHGYPHSARAESRLHNWLLETTARNLGRRCLRRG